MKLGTRVVFKLMTHKSEFCDSNTVLSTNIF